MTEEEQQKALEYADMHYCAGSNDDIEFVYPPHTSAAEDGCWVLAKLWVPAAAYEENPDDDI